MASRVMHLRRRMLRQLVAQGILDELARLPDAINRKLLSPFQYFCITDNVDLDGFQWQRGGYRVSDLQNVYTGNDLRAGLVIDKVCGTLLDVRQARGLGFCVSMAHAEYMARKFTEAGIPAAALTAESPDETRHADEARPAMEACGIDVFATVRRHGFTIDVVRSNSDPQNYFGLVLVD